jgi:hypothetical protein
MDRIRALQASISEQLEAMSARDRNLLTLLICMVTLVVVGGITYSLQGVLQDRATRVVEAKRHLVEAQGLAGEYAVLRGRIDAAEARMGTFSPGKVNTYLEQWATEAGVVSGFRSSNERGKRQVGDYTERDHDARLQRSELPGVLKFLYLIETSPYPLEISNAKFKVIQTKDDRFIDLDLGLKSMAKENG